MRKGSAKRRSTSTSERFMMSISSAIPPSPNRLRRKREPISSHVCARRVVMGGAVLYRLTWKFESTLKLNDYAATRYLQKFK